MNKVLIKGASSTDISMSHLIAVIPMPIEKKEGRVSIDF